MEKIDNPDDERIAQMDAAVSALALYNKEVYAEAKAAIADGNQAKFVSIAKRVNIDEETANKIYTTSTTTALSW